MIRTMLLLAILLTISAPISALNPEDCSHVTVYDFLHNDRAGLRTHLEDIIRGMQAELPLDVNQYYNWRHTLADNIPPCKPMTDWALYSTYIYTDLLLLQHHKQHNLPVPQHASTAIASSSELWAITLNYMIDINNLYVDSGGYYGSLSDGHTNECSNRDIYTYYATNKIALIDELANALDDALNTNTPDMQRYYLWRTLLASQLVRCDLILHWSIASFHLYTDTIILLTWQLHTPAPPLVILEAVTAAGLEATHQTQLLRKAVESYLQNDASTFNRAPTATPNHRDASDSIIATALAGWNATKTAIARQR